MHNDEIHNLMCPRNIITADKPRMMRWAGHVTRVWNMRNPYKISVYKSEGKRPLRRPRRR